MFPSSTIIRELVQSLAKLTLLLKHSVKLCCCVLCADVAARVFSDTEYIINEMWRCWMYKFGSDYGPPAISSQQYNESCRLHKMWDFFYYLNISKRILSNNLSHTYTFLQQGCTNPGRQIAVANKFCTVAPSICRSSVWNMLYVILLQHRILNLLLDF
jgi:hypothetical protein